MLQGEHSAILLTFIKLPFDIKIFVLSIFKWEFYTGLRFFCSSSLGLGKTLKTDQLIDSSVYILWDNSFEKKNVYIIHENSFYQSKPCCCLKCHFIGVFTVCRSTCLWVSSIKSVLIHIWTKNEVGAPWNQFKPSSKIFLLTIPRGCFFCGSFMLFLSCFVTILCTSVCWCLVVTYWERADLLALVCDVCLWSCHFPIGILG